MEEESTGNLSQETLEKVTGITFKSPELAFAQAFRSGRLSRDPDSRMFAGYYMYMGTQDGRDQFKHSLTRKYLP